MPRQIVKRDPSTMTRTEKEISPQKKVPKVLKKKIAKAGKKSVRNQTRSKPATKKSQKTTRSYDPNTQVVRLNIKEFEYAGVFEDSAESKIKRANST